jgi:tRNA wybutosine-synthesizing protein 3
MTMFEAQKKKALERLRIRGADEEIAGIIEKINSFDDFFTTSSCSGRIALICIPEIGAKREAKFIGKWHRPVTKEEVLEAIKLKSSAEASEKGEVWLLSQSPILHVSCRGLEKAKMLLRIAIQSGFKYSSIKAIANSKDNEKAIVEIVSTERMDVPLGKDGVMFCSEAYMDFILSKANYMLERGKGKLKRFYYGLKEVEENLFLRRKG